MPLHPTRSAPPIERIERLAAESFHEPLRIGRIGEAPSRSTTQMCVSFIDTSNRIEQDHRRIKRRVRPMLDFKSTVTASIILSGIEMVAMMHKRQARFAFNPAPSLAEQFAVLAA